MKPPDTVLVAIRCADDSVAIMAFVTTEYHGDGTPRWSRPANDAEVASEVDRASAAFDPATLPIKDWRFVAREELPSDRTFRNAWRDEEDLVEGRRLKVHMPKAREIHRERIREARAPLLAQLDVEVQRADEDGDQEGRRRAIARKRELRNAPADPAIDAAQTPDELKAVWPKSLEER